MNPGARWSLDWSEPQLSIFALLLLSHVLVGWLPACPPLRRPSLAPPKLRARRFLFAVLLGGVLLLPYLPYLEGMVFLVAAGGIGAILDATRAGLDRRLPDRRLWWLLAELGLRLVALIVLSEQWSVDPGPPALLGRLAFMLAVIVFTARGGSVIVRETLAGIDGEEQDGEQGSGPSGAGRRIGVLERWIVVMLVCTDQWGAVGLVLTAKSVARFKRMDEQRFAEVYLVGTMTSVLVAMLSGFLLRATL